MCDNEIKAVHLNRSAEERERERVVRLDRMKSLKSAISLPKCYISLPFYINFSYQCQNEIAFVCSILHVNRPMLKHITWKSVFQPFHSTLKEGKTKPETEWNETKHFYMFFVWFYFIASLIPLCGLNFHEKYKTYNINVSICARCHLKSRRNLYLPNKLTYYSVHKQANHFICFVNRRMKFCRTGEISSELKCSNWFSKSNISIK